MGTLAYLTNLLRDKNVASVTPTSRFGVRRMCRLVDFAKAEVIIEYGPGGGVITRGLLAQMRPDAVLIVIERNPDFARRLADSISDKRLYVVNASAEDVLLILARLNLPCAQYIISGIPFSFFPNELKDSILESTTQALDREGSFIVYQFFSTPLGKGEDISRKLAEKMELVGEQVELLNIPPLRIFEARGGAGTVTETVLSRRAHDSANVTSR